MNNNNIYLAKISSSLEELPEIKDRLDFIVDELSETNSKYDELLDKFDELIEVLKHVNKS